MGARKGVWRRRTSSSGHALRISFKVLYKNYRLVFSRGMRDVCTLSNPLKGLFRGIQGTVYFPSGSSQAHALAFHDIHGAFTLLSSHK